MTSPSTESELKNLQEKKRAQGIMPEAAKPEVGTAPTDEIFSEVSPDAQKNVETQQTADVESETGGIGKAVAVVASKLQKSKNKSGTIPTVRDDLTIRVEKIMEENLETAYKELTPIQQQQFKIKGEQTAFAIRQLLKKTHVHIKKIFRLIFAWLKFLPGVSKYYTIQEAKIKADKIAALKHFTNHDGKK